MMVLSITTLRNFFDPGQMGNFCGNVDTVFSPWPSIITSNKEIFSSEAFASELLENLEEIFP